MDPSQALTGDCGFLAANLYARSIFGEDALANLSIEKALDGSEDSPVQGHIRIRAKTQVRQCNNSLSILLLLSLQGMALSLGDKINLSQKSSAPANSASGSSGKDSN